jgi:hypothetical protein
MNILINFHVITLKLSTRQFEQVDISHLFQVMYMLSRFSCHKRSKTNMLYLKESDYFKKDDIFCYLQFVYLDFSLIGSHPQYMKENN